MVTRSNIDMLLNLDERYQPRNGNLDEGLQGELEFMLQAQRNQRVIDRERDLNVYRSGSAPPTVEGSLNAVRSLYGTSNFFDNNSGISGSSSSGSSNVVLTEDEIRSHPAYLSYYYSHENINPRLPPPLLSKEDWRVAQRFRAGGYSVKGAVDLRRKAVDDSDGSSLFSMQPGLLVQKAENDLMELRNVGRRNLAAQGSVEWLDRGSDGLIGLQGGGLGARRKSFADILQEGLDRRTSFSGHLSRPASVNAFGEFVDTTDISVPHHAVLCNGVASAEQLHSGATLPGLVAAQSHGTTASLAFASAVGSSLSRSTTPEQQLVGRSPSTGLPPVGSRAGPIEKKNAIGMAVQNGNFSGMTEIGDIASTLSGLSLSKFRQADQDGHKQGQVQLNVDGRPDFPFSMSSGRNQIRQQRLIEKSNAENRSLLANYIDAEGKNIAIPNLNASKINSNGGLNIPKRTFSSVSLYSKVNPPGFEKVEISDIHLQNVNIPNLDFNGHTSGSFAVNHNLHSLINNHLDAGSSLDGSRIGLSLNKVGNQLCGPPVIDPRYSQYLQGTSDHRARTAASPGGSQVRNYFGTSNGDFDEIEKAYLEALLAQQKQQYELPLLGKSGDVNQGYYKNSLYGLGLPYSGKSVANSVLPSAGPVTFQNEQVAQFTSMMKSSMGGSIGSRHSDIGTNVERRYLSSLLEEFKNNKARSFELSDIINHVVEFSTDQYGSRFIQQKLETATVEEKNMIFPEIITHAHSLMTDVFGNYVIQKFFEHGTESQRVELASQLSGHVLPLSLQMYGCRVIQKALEAVDVDRQTQMVAELDGSVLKCVRDQNGNHVVQKCIECVPEDRIQFIISSFYGQVVALSMHPYGCRVIQRVLEHCRDMNTKQVIMDEIMQSVCILAQDQYGNYVIQHVLEHGKPDVRSDIIRKLAGQIVKMSQQKFASNVVERCLTFGGPEERQLLVNEMLGSTDENEPLQAMMKDPFGNYVVQKVLETCDDWNLELILSRIRVHLNTLKRYTYGKHIVSRIEKLITTGERRIGLSSSFTSQVV